MIGGEEQFTTAHLDVQGSGSCRYRMWTFEYYGAPITVKELGCYGEVHPPKDAIGEVEFSNNYAHSVYCYPAKKLGDPKS